MLNHEIVDFLRGGVSLLVASRNAQMRTECGRLVGIFVEPGRDRVSVYLPIVTGAAILAQLKDNGAIAVTASQPNDHRTIQLKGQVVSIERAGDDERAGIDAYVSRFAAVLDPLGMPANLVRRLSAWPAWRITFSVRDLYQQTPGPGAGTRLKGPST